MKTTMPPYPPAGNAAGKLVTLARDAQARARNNAQVDPPDRDGGAFPSLARFPRVSDDQLAVESLWMETADYWLSIPSGPFRERSEALWDAWTQFLDQHSLAADQHVPIDSSDWLRPLARENPRAYAPFNNTSLVELFLARVEDELRASGQEPPLEFWRLSAKLALFAAEFGAACFEGTIRERQAEYDNPNVAQRKPCFRPDALAASWRREDPAVLNRLLLQAEAAAESNGCPLPVPAYRIAICYALAIARREEAWESFYANDQDLDQ